MNREPKCLCGYNPETGYRTDIVCPKHDNRGDIDVAGTKGWEPIRLDDLCRVVEAPSGSELFRITPVPTISMREHELLMEWGFAEYDRLWKDLAGM